MNDAAREDVLARLLDALTPILLDLAKLPGILETINERLCSINNNMVRIHDRLDFLVVDHDAVDKATDELNEVIPVIRAHNTLLAEKNKLDAEALKNRTLLSKIKWNSITKIILAVVGSSGTIYYLLKYLVEAITK